MKHLFPRSVPRLQWMIHRSWHQPLSEVPFLPQKAVQIETREQNLDFPNNCDTDLERDATAGYNFPFKPEERQPSSICKDLKAHKPFSYTFMYTVHYRH